MYSYTCTDKPTKPNDNFIQLIIKAFILIKKNNLKNLNLNSFTKIDFHLQSEILIKNNKIIKCLLIHIYCETIVFI